MPVMYRCAKCGSIIFAFVRAGQDYYGIPSPSELFIRIGNRCPHCGKDLENNIDLAKIEVRIIK